MGSKKPEPTSFGKNLRHFRRAAGLTQAELAELVGTNRLIITQLETRPTSNPTLSTLRKLATALNCTVADLVAEE